MQCGDVAAILERSVETGGDRCRQLTVQSCLQFRFRFRFRFPGQFSAYLLV